MSMTLDGGEGTLTTSAQSLTTVLGLSAPLFFTHLSMRLAIDALGILYFGKSNLTTVANRCGFLEPREAFYFGLDGTFTNTDQIFVLSTNAGDRVFVANMR